MDQFSLVLFHVIQITDVIPLALKGFTGDFLGASLHFFIHFFYAIHRLHKPAKQRPWPSSDVTMTLQSGWSHFACWLSLQGDCAHVWVKGPRGLEGAHGHAVTSYVSAISMYKIGLI